MVTCMDRTGSARVDDSFETSESSAHKCVSGSLQDAEKLVVRSHATRSDTDATRS